jgi:hypothetical protein
MHPPTLEQLQRWLLAVITHPAGIEAGIETARGEIDVEARDVEQVVARSERQTSIERLAVYGNAYFLRLLECLRELFPCLAETIGSETFDQFAIAYLHRYPPRSYTLGRLADRFVQFLEETRPAEDGDERAGEVEIAWPEFVVDLARLEDAIEQVFDARGPEESPQLSAADLANVDPAAWAAMRLKLATGMQLLAFRFPVSTHFTDWKRAEAPDFLAPAAQYVALFRREYIVRRYELSRPQYELLLALQNGAAVAEAIELAAEHLDDFDQFAADLRRWFEFWSAEQFFMG